jgi:hypothetical protein
LFAHTFIVYNGKDMKAERQNMSPEIKNALGLNKKIMFTSTAVPGIPNNRRHPTF